MNVSLTILELAVLALGLGILMLDLWTPPELKRKLGYAAAFGIAVIFLLSFSPQFGAGGSVHFAFGRSYVLDGLAIFFKRFFLLAAFLIILLAVEYADRIESGVSEYYSLILFALLGMMFAASANDFVMLFVSLELVTVTFYVLTSFRRNRLASLEAGVKYLIQGALASAFLVYGIALVYGTTGAMDFPTIAKNLGANPLLRAQPVLWLGLLLMLAGFAFKLAAFPFQFWAPDVYQGAPMPTVAFLAIGSKAAGIVLLLRVFGAAVPEVALQWRTLLMVIAVITILYGNLCAIPQRNLKRLFGYSSIANSGYIMLGIAAMSRSGSSAALYFLAGYLFTVLASFAALTLILRDTELEDISSLNGLGQRSPLLAAALTLSMVSLAGIPPLAGFLGKFLLLKAVIEQGATNPSYYWVLLPAIAGVLISIYYYFGVVRVMYWPRETNNLAPIEISRPTRAALYACIFGILYLGIFPNTLLNTLGDAVTALRF